jgi:hypothetical protein
MKVSARVKDKATKYKELLWENDEIQINVEVPISEIALSSLQICIWSD